MLRGQRCLLQCSMELQNRSGSSHAWSEAKARGKQEKKKGEKGDKDKEGSLCGQPQEEVESGRERNKVREEKCSERRLCRSEGLDSRADCQCGGKASR